MDQKREDYLAALENCANTEINYQDSNFLDLQMAKIVSLLPTSNMSFIYLSDAAQKTLSVNYVNGMPKELANKLTLEITNTACGKVFKSGIPQIINGCEKCTVILKQSPSHIAFWNYTLTYPNAIIYVPLILNQKTIGVFALFNNQYPGHEFINEDLFFLERATTLLALIINKIQLEKNRKLLGQYSKFNIITNDLTESLHQAGMDSSGFFSIIVIDSFSKNSNNYCSDNLGANFIDIITVMLEKANINGLVFRDNSRYCVMAYFKNCIDCKDGKKRLALLVDDLSKLNSDNNFGVGSIYQNLSDIKKSYDEANHCMALLANYPLKTNILKYYELGIFKVLSINKEETYNYLQYVLAPIIAYDKKKNSDLWETLRLYVKYNRAQNLVAGKLYAHVNTVYCRIKKIQELLDADFNNPNDWFEIQVVCNLIDALNLDYEYLVDHLKGPNCCN